MEENKMAKSPEEMTTSMIQNLKDKTGKSLDEWITIAKASGLAKHGEIIKYLKSEHGLTHGYANLVAHKSKGSDAGSAADSSDLVESQYTGPKAGLRPIYDSLIKRVKEFGGDVELAPKKAYVSLRRKKQFAVIQPSTKTRVDVGLNLKGTEPTDRLEVSGSFNAMCSHRVRITDINQVDDELTGWLKQAYDQS
jgi:predicted transport protein